MHVEKQFLHKVSWKWLNKLDECHGKVEVLRWSEWTSILATILWISEQFYENKSNRIIGSFWEPIATQFNIHVTPSIWKLLCIHSYSNMHLTKNFKNAGSFKYSYCHLGRIVEHTFHNHQHLSNFFPCRILMLLLFQGCSNRSKVVFLMLNLDKVFSERDVFCLLM